MTHLTIQTFDFHGDQKEVCPRTGMILADYVSQLATVSLSPRPERETLFKHRMD